MRMSHLASIAFACSISLFSTASFAQEPSNGPCDDESYVTPSLYGLCIAYWATQENGESEASSKILEKYNARKSDGVDPDMPGLVTCPCWSEAELEEWKGKVLASGGDLVDHCSDVLVPANGILSWYTESGDSLQTHNSGIGDTQFVCTTNISTDLSENGVFRPEGNGVIELDDETVYETCYTSLSTICP